MGSKLSIVQGVIFMITSTTALFGKPNALRASTDGSLHDLTSNTGLNLRTDLELPKALTGALKTLEDLEKMPSCNKVAAADLLNSCQSLEDPTSLDDIPRGPDLILDQVKTIYAARLAVCELGEVDESLVPIQCSKFVPNEYSLRQKAFSGRINRDGPSRPTKHYPKYEAITEASLAACLDGLYADPRAWNSFTNAKQNAIGICQATRAFVEKDEMLHFYKAMHGVTGDIFTAQNRSAGHMAALQSTFSDLIRNVNKTVIQLHEERMERESQWADWLLQFQNVSEDLRHVQDLVQKTSKSIHQNEEQVVQININYRQLIDDFFQQLTKDVNLSYHQLQQMNNQVTFITEMVEQGLVKKVYSLTNDIGAANSIVHELRKSADLANMESLNLRSVITGNGKIVVTMQQDLDRFISQQRRNHQELTAYHIESVAAAQQMNAQIQNATEALSTLAVVPIAIKGLVESLSWFRGSLAPYTSVAIWVLTFSILMATFYFLWWTFCHLLLAPLRCAVAPVTLLRTAVETLPWWMTASILYTSISLTWFEGLCSTANRWLIRGPNAVEMIFGAVVASGVIIQALLARYESLRAHLPQNDDYDDDLAPEPGKMDA